MEQFLRDGTPRALARRALADRLPKQVLEETRTGLQMADWHVDLTAARNDIIEELDRLEACPAAAATLDLPRLRRLSGKLAVRRLGTRQSPRPLSLCVAACHRGWALPFAGDRE